MSRNIPFGVVVLTALALLGSAAVATPSALAQGNETKADEGNQAWVDDCPPDMMCAAGSGGSSNASTGGDSEEPAKGSQDADEEPREGGNVSDDGTDEPRDGGNAWVEDCPPDKMCAASGPDEPVDNSSDNASSDNCMDGADEGEDCQDDVYYMNPPDDGREPAYNDGREVDTTAADGTEDTDDASAQGAGPEDAQERDVPAFSMLLGVGMLGGLAIAIRRVQ